MTYFDGIGSQAGQRKGQSYDGNAQTKEYQRIAIAFSVRRIHQYIFGRKVIVETDYRPLQRI